MPTPTATIAFLLGTLVFIVGRAVALGRRAALATAAGNLVGALAIVAAVSLGVGAIIERAAIALLVLTFAGAAYLV